MSDIETHITDNKRSNSKTYRPAMKKRDFYFTAALAQPKSEGRAHERDCSVALSGSH